jgi:hypothetical protein
LRFAPSRPGSYLLATSKSRASERIPLCRNKPLRLAEKEITAHLQVVIHSHTRDRGVLRTCVRHVAIVIPPISMRPCGLSPSYFTQDSHCKPRGEKWSVSGLGIPLAGSSRSSMESFAREWKQCCYHCLDIPLSCNCSSHCILHRVWSITQLDLQVSTFVRTR